MKELQGADDIVCSGECATAVGSRCTELRFATNHSASVDIVSHDVPPHCQLQISRCLADSSILTHSRYLVERSRHFYRRIRCTHIFLLHLSFSLFFFLNNPPPPEISPLPLHGPLRI